MSELLVSPDGVRDFDVVTEFGDGVGAIGSGVLVAENVRGITGLETSGSLGVISGITDFFAKNGVIVAVDGTRAPKIADGVSIICAESKTCERTKVGVFKFASAWRRGNGAIALDKRCQYDQVAMKRTGQKDSSNKRNCTTYEA